MNMLPWTVDVEAMVCASWMMARAVAAGEWFEEMLFVPMRMIALWM